MKTKPFTSQAVSAQFLLMSRKAAKQMQVLETLLKIYFIITETQIHILD